mgnify:CR=1 FL=1
MREGWEYKKLGEVCNVINGLWTGKKEPFINVAVIRNTNFSKDCQLNLDNVAYIDVEAKQFASRKLLLGDIIIEKSGGSEKQPVGRPILFNISEGDYSFSNFTSTLRIKEDAKVESSFLHKCLYAFYLKGETLKLQSKTTGLHNLNMKGYLRQNIPLPPKSTQLAIVSELDKINELIRLKKEQLKDFDNLAQSIFYEMFGDPVENEMGWEVKKLGEIGEVKTGNTPSRSNVNFYNEKFIEWIKTDNIRNEQMNPTTAAEYLSREGAECGRIVSKGSILVACIAGSLSSIGKCCITTKNVAFNQQINAITPYEEFCNSIYLYELIRNSSKYIQQNATTGMKHILSKSIFEKMKFPLPPLTLQHLFAHRIEQIEHQKSEVQNAITDLETLLASRMQYWFE